MGLSVQWNVAVTSYRQMTWKQGTKTRIRGRYHLQSPSLMIHFLQLDSLYQRLHNLQATAPAGDQMFRHMRLLGTIQTQTITRGRDFTKEPTLTQQITPRGRANTSKTNRQKVQVDPDHIQARSDCRPTGTQVWLGLEAGICNPSLWGLSLLVLVRDINTQACLCYRAHNIPCILQEERKQHVPAQIRPLSHPALVRGDCNGGQLSSTPLTRWCFG